MGKKMAGTNEFAFFFAVKAYIPGGGVQNQAEKNSRKCLPAGTGTKIYFSRLSKIRVRVWELRGQNPHCKYLAALTKPLFYFVTLLALQKSLRNIFFSFLPGNFALKNGGDFW